MASTMRIDTAFFDRLVWKTDAIEAVATLSQFWTTRARSGEGNFGLALAEYRVTLCLIYSGEVGNGATLSTSSTETRPFQTP
jgi:hypothetical protein